MDTTGCPPGLATDRVFLKDTPVGLCNVELALYWGISFTVCALRLIAFLGKVRNYVAVVGFRIRSRRILTVLVSLGSTVSYFLLASLIGVNVVNADNGWSFSLYSIGYFAFIIDFTMMLFKIVRLGRRVIALPKEQLGQTEDDYLAKFTKRGIVLAFLQIVMAIVSSIVLIIMSPIYPDKELVLGTIGFATKGMFQILCSFGIILQFQRCVRAIDRLVAAQTKTGLTTEGERTLRRVIVARGVLRQRQIFIFLFGTGVGILILLLSFAIPWHWGWVLTATAGPEAVGHLLAEFVLNRRRSSPKSSSSRKEANGNEERSSSSKRSATEPLSAEGPFMTFMGLRIPNRTRPRKVWKLDLSKIAEAEESKMSSSIHV